MTLSPVPPPWGGGARSFAPLARSESAGKAIRPPKGYPSRRSGSSLQLRGETLEHCDAGGVGTIALRPTAAIAVSGTQLLPQDEGANSTYVIRCSWFQMTKNMLRFCLDSHGNPSVQFSSTGAKYVSRQFNLEQFRSCCACLTLHNKYRSRQLLVINFFQDTQHVLHKVWSKNFLCQNRILYIRVTPFWIFQNHEIVDAPVCSCSLYLNSCELWLCFTAW